MVTEKFQQILSPANASRLVDKLRFVEDSLPPLGARRLAVAVAERGDSYPGEQGFFSLGSAFQQAAVLIMKLLRRLPPGDERDNAAELVMEAAKPLPFALQCLSWLRTDDSAGKKEGPLSSAAEQRVATIVVGRIREAARHAPPYIEFPRVASAILWVWQRYGPDGELERYLTARLDADPSEIGPFLAAFALPAGGWSQGSRDPAT